MPSLMDRRGSLVLRQWQFPSGPEPNSDIDGAAFYKEHPLPVFGCSPDTPALLVDRLGAFSDDPVLMERVEAVFNERHNYFYNASGVGKTRIILEGLVANWGLYITCAYQPKRIGSADMTSLMGDATTINSGFSAILSGDGATQASQLRQNERIVRLRVFAIILARITILGLFLAAMRKQQLSPQDSQCRRLWVLLQLDPTILSLIDPTVSRDVFHDLSLVILREHGDTSSEQSMRRTMSAAMRGLKKDLEDLPFYVVLDEAQDAARAFPAAFRSAADPTRESVSSIEGQERPLLRAVVMNMTTYLESTRKQAFIIMTGTSLTAQDVNSFLGETDLRGAVSDPVTFGHDNYIGGFDSYEDMLRYVQLYIPRDRCEGRVGNILLQRMYKWLRGRYRFTVAYLVLLLKAGLRSPHRLLDLFVYACTGHTPSDGIHSILLSGGEKSELASIFVDEPPVDDSILDSLTLSSVSGIDFTKLREKAHYQEQLMINVRCVIFDLINRSVVKTALGSQFSPEVVGMGLGRSSRPDSKWGAVEATDADDSDDETMDVDVPEQNPVPPTSSTAPSSSVSKDPVLTAIINEPLVIIALAHYLNSTALQSAYFHFASSIFVDGSKNNGWENYIAQSLILVLSAKDPVLLRQLFLFRNTRNLPVDSLARKNEGITVRLAYIFGRDGSRIFSSEFRDEMPGTESKSFDASLEWLRDMTTPLLFPDQLFGPDLIFVLRLSTGEHVWAAVQCKYHSHPSPFLTSRLPTTNDAVRSTTPNKYYISKSSTPSEEENSRNEEVRRQLRALPGLTKNAGECGLIRAMAYIPSLADLSRSTLVDPDTGNHPVAEINLDFVRGRTKPFPPADVMAEALTKDGIEPINAKYAPETPFPLPENLSERYEQAWSYRQSIMEKKDDKGQLVAPRISDADAAPAPRTRSAAKKRPRQSTESTDAATFPGIIAIPPDSPSSKARVGRVKSTKRARKAEQTTTAAAPGAQPSLARGKSAKR
ncbi:hypothetical protein EV714DRAFT_273955 [Schizophyllum commune]